MLPTLLTFNHRNTTFYNSHKTIPEILSLINEAVELIYTLDAGFRQKETGQAREDFDWSFWLTRIGCFSNRLLGDLRLVAELST